VRSSAVRSGSSWTNYSSSRDAGRGDAGPRCDRVPLLSVDLNICLGMSRFEVQVAGELTHQTRMEIMGLVIDRRFEIGCLGGWACGRAWGCKTHRVQCEPE